MSSTIQNGPSTYRLLSTADTNLGVIKAAAARLYMIAISNTHAANKAFVKLYNKAEAPTLVSDVPVFTIPVNAAEYSPVMINFEPGIFFDKGIAIAVTGAVGDTDTTAVAANQVIVNGLYK